MEDFRTWREILSASGSRDYDEQNLYWPFGFPRDFLLYCSYFADIGLQKHFPWSRTSCPPQVPIFLTFSPLYITDTAPCQHLDEAKESVNECDDRDEDFIAAAPKKRAFAPSYRSVLARDASRHLFAGQPPAKETRVIEQRQAIELLPKIRTAIGSIGMANHVIRSLVSGCGSYRHCVYNSFRNSVRIAARIFGSKRHRVLFPYFNGLYYSIPQQSPLALAIQVCHSASTSFDAVSLNRTQATALSYLKSGSNPSNVQTAVKTGNICLVAAMLDSGVTADSK